MEYELLNLLLAFITLILGGALIIFIYDAYRISRDPGLLYLTVGLFLLIIGLVLPDILLPLAGTFGSGWGVVIGRIMEIVGIGVMIVSVLKE
ncbi:MAG: DUF7521 family protein [Methanoculleaceae archaeon]